MCISNHHHLWTSFRATILLDSWLQTYVQVATNGKMSFFSLIGFIGYFLQISLDSPHGLVKFKVLGIGNPFMGLHHSGVLVELSFKFLHRKKNTEDLDLVFRSHLEDMLKN